MMFYAPAALADVFDRLTILAIKHDHLSEGPARTNVEREQAALLAAWRSAGLPDPAAVPEHAALLAANRALWAVEDRLRAAEACQDFGPAFVADARSVYRTNDERAALKRAINARFGSMLVEEKLHPTY